MNKAWESKIVDPDWVIKKIKPGMRIFVGSGAAEPRTMVRHLMASGSGRLEDIELIQLLSFGEALTPEALQSKTFRLKTFFSGSAAVAAITRGQVDFIPSRFVQIPHLIEAGRVNIEVAIVQITPPNAAGYCSLGVAVDVAREAMEMATLVVGEINPYIPRTLGDTFVALDAFDVLIESDDEPLYAERWPVDDVLNRTAFNVSSLIEDGSCIATSIGPLYEALGRNLSDKKDLGIHSPFFTDVLMELMLCGAVTNRRKETHRDRSLTSYAIGTRGLFEWLDNNPLVEFQRIDRVFSPSNIGRNRRFVTVIPVNKIDLFGRVSLQAGKGNIATGPAEVMDFFNGAELSPGGRAIFALTSRDHNQKANVALSIADEPNQFSLFESVNIVVTEYGIAYLEGHTVRERAQKLIDIAHPDDRSRLVEQAREKRILYKDQIFLSDSARLYPGDIFDSHTFKGNLKIGFRAIKPSDEEGMRRLFYRFSDDSVYSRYFQSVTAMPHAKMQAYVNVDWNQVMSIVGLVDEKGEAYIIAEGRYIRIPGTEKAEVVFVVDEKYQSVGIATHIYGMLVGLARGRGVKEFVADVMFSNAAMMKVFRKGDLPVKAILESGVYHLEIALT